MIPVAGAVIGTAIAGPVGLIAGLKIGKIAAVSCGLLGLLVHHDLPSLSELYKIPLYFAPR